MTSSEAETATVPADEGIQQIPAVMSVTEVPAASDARDKLLKAIGAEAQLVAEKSAGQASAALAELARAYALVTGGTTTVGPVAASAHRLQRVEYSGVTLEAGTDLITN